MFKKMCEDSGIQIQQYKNHEFIFITTQQSPLSNAISTYDLHAQTVLVTKKLDCATILNMNYEEISKIYEELIKKTHDYYDELLVQPKGL